MKYHSIIMAVVVAKQRTEEGEEEKNRNKQIKPQKAETYKYKERGPLGQQKNSLVHKFSFVTSRLIYY